MNATDRQQPPAPTLAFARWALAGAWMLGILVTATGPDLTGGRLDWVAAGAHASAGMATAFLLANALRQHVPPAIVWFAGLAGALLFVASVEAVRLALLGFANGAPSLGLDTAGAVAGALLFRRCAPRIRDLENALRS